MPFAEWSIRCGLAAVLLTLASTAGHGEASARADDGTPLAEAMRLGEQLYRHDQAAWRATDRLLPELTDDLVPLMRGYIVVPGKDDRLETLFFAEVDGRIVEMARYGVSRGGRVRGGLTPDRPPLSPETLRLVSARNAALEHAAHSDFALCANANPNVVVLPPDAGDMIAVYILTPMVENGVYPLGGHLRVRIDPGGRVVDSRTFMNTCFPLRFGSDAGGQRGEAPELQVVTHILDDTPTEIHAFASRYVPIPLMVVTVESRSTWLVNQGRIEFVAKLEDDGTMSKSR